MEKPSSLDFRRLFESAPGLYLVLSPEFQIVAVTDAYLAATMTKREDVLGKGLFEVFPDNPDDDSATGEGNLRDSLETVLREKKANTMAVQKYDIRKPESEGGGFEERFWSPRNTPVLDTEGSVEFIIHRVEDVTEFVHLKQQGLEQSKLAQELRTHAQQMEGEVFLRAQEVQQVNKELQSAHDELSQLYENAKELDELKTQFFANVSHELRTPLTLILGPARRRLAEENISPVEREVLEVVERNARLLLKHVNDLLDLAKLEAGRVTMEYSEGDLVKFSRLIASHFQTSAEDRQIELEVNTSEKLSAQFDAGKLQRILLNLLSNALKFTPPGGTVRLSVSAEAEKAILSVEDSGPGIPVHMREAVFERFRQVDGNVTRHYGGTGLGLAIVNEFVDLHHGQVRVGDSSLGGALLTVKLPLIAPDGFEVEKAEAVPLRELADDSADELRLQSHVSTEEGSMTGSGLPLILVVEDNPDMRDFLLSSLKQHYRVVSASNGVEGISKATELRPDLIISDMMMPEVSGDEMVKALRAAEGFEDIPIVMLTAKADDEIRVNLLKEHVQEYLSKPFSVEDLFARVGRHISEGRRLASMKGLIAAVVESSQDAIVGITSEGTVTSWNPGAERLYGYTASQMIGNSISSLVTPPHQQKLTEVLSAVKEGKVLEDLGWLDRGAAKKLDVSANISPLRNGAGDIVGASIVVRDVSAQRRAEREIRSLNAELELKVLERTREFEQANRELESFSYSVSHDLRTPLRSIDGFSQALLEDQFDRLDDDGKDYLQRVRGAAKRMSQLIEDLLMLSRLSRSEFYRQTVDLSLMVHEIADNIQRQEPERKVEFVIEDGVTAEGDGRLLRIALENLLGNAWKFTSKRERARIEFGAVEEDGKPACFVRDNGAGFDMAHSKQLFGAFQRLHSPNEFAGTGIGLATVQRVITRHRGWIRGEGAVDEGATFTFQLGSEA